MTFTKEDKGKDLEIRQIEVYHLNDYVWRFFFTVYPKTVRHGDGLLRALTPYMRAWLSYMVGSFPPITFSIRFYKVKRIR